MAMQIAAAERGIGTGHSAVGDRPLRPIRRPNRRPFAEVVHRGRW